MKRLVVALIAGLACVATTAAAAPSQDATLTVEVAPAVKFPATGKVTLPVVLKLRCGKTMTALESSNPCRVKTWVTTDFRGLSVENHSVCTAEYDPQEQSLVPGEVLTEKTEIVLDAAKYHGAEDYILRFSFWGVEATAKFKVEKAL